MNNEERHIISKAGKENHFQVPEAYFENFATKMMESLPERKAKHIWLRPLIAAAACVALVFGITTHLLKMEESTLQNSAMAAEAMATNSYEEDFADYAMIDNMDIYAYMADE